jgi:phosphoglycolate phosphatase-like HAD superfamily hydrolase
MQFAKPAWIFDIDGTLSDTSHRHHLIAGEPKKWDEYFKLCGGDARHEHICLLARSLASVQSGPVVMFVSGRSDICREETQRWIESEVGLMCPANRLYMRKQGDHKPDDVLKIELLEQIRADGFEPVMAFDDRNRVVAAWRAAGIPCAQVAEGDF